MPPICKVLNKPFEQGDIYRKDKEENAVLSFKKFQS